MKNKKIIRKINWISNIDIENLLAWFSDMASQGYHFKENKKYYTIFELGNPKEVNYISAHINRHDEEGIKSHKSDFGWEYVSSNDDYHYYVRQVNSDLSNINDASMFIHNIEKFKKNIMSPSLSEFTTLLIIVAFIAVLLSTKIPKELFLDNRFLGLLFAALSAIMSNIQSVVSHYRLRSVYEKQIERIPLDNKKLYKSSFKVSKIIKSIAFTFTFAFLILSLVDMFNLVNYDRFEKIPDGDIGIIRIEDIAEGEYTYEHIYKKNTRKDYVNYLEKNTSILVPNQYKLEQSIIFDDVNNMGKNKKMYIRAYKYVTINNVVAKKMIPDLIENYAWVEYKEVSDIEKSKYKNIDELFVVCDERGNHIVARKNKTIYKVICFSDDPLVVYNRILEEISKEL